ncbi:MAG: UDP-galactopyranose mutase [Uliginosibacterium sp.]|nr:UDP-galactopyranose mutase [Uliginosibacterium sp.]
MIREKYDWVVVGAGITGTCFAERIASQRRESVLLIEQRPHIGGNLYDEVNEFGILEHKYGPHIFHTNSTEVWDYLSQFTSWRPYTHHILAAVDGKLVPLPINLNSVEQLFPGDRGTRLVGKLIALYGFGARVPVLKMRDAADEDVRALAEYVYQRVFENYTWKQWQLRPEELAPSVTARVPIVISRDDRCFQDTYQGLPLDGYTAMMRRMLAQPGITLRLGCSWHALSDQIDANRIVYTGPIDEYFACKHGALPYRSLRFEATTVAQARVQSVGTVNFPNEHDYTRITEMAHLTGQVENHSTLLYEYPQAHVPGETIPYYPIPMESNRQHYAQYCAEARNTCPDVIFAGRLADYMYYNIDQAVASALSKFKRLVESTGESRDETRD